MFLVQTFEDNHDKVTKKYTDLGWNIIGLMRQTNNVRPERGDVIFVSLEWPDHLGEPVHPVNPHGL